MFPQHPPHWTPLVCPQTPPTCSQGRTRPLLPGQAQARLPCRQTSLSQCSSCGTLPTTLAPFPPPGDVPPSSRALKPSLSVRLLVAGGCPPRSPLHDGRPWGRSQQQHVATNQPSSKQRDQRPLLMLTHWLPRSHVHVTATLVCHSDAGMQALGPCQEGANLVLTASEPRRQPGSFQRRRATGALSDTELPVLSPHLPRLRELFCPAARSQTLARPPASHPRPQPVQSLPRPRI